MENPFETLLTRLKNLEEVQREILSLLEKIQSQQGHEENMTVHQASKFLKLSEPTIHRLKANGKIPYVKIGSRVIYQRSELKKWMSSINGNKVS